MKSELTIIIPFLNEGSEIENTIQSILETAVTNLRILLINDNSNDNFNYNEMIRKYGNKVSYVLHKERKGVAASRNEGVSLSETPYFLLLDGHMRFYETGWDERLIDLLKKHPGTILCSQTQALKKDRSGHVTVEPLNHFGAYIDLKSLKTVWNKHDEPDHSNLMEIPCILGAAYAVEKSYWLHLHGLNGLLSYGMDEQLLSMKVWLEGGRCLLVNDWVTGHIYRESFPYMNPTQDIIYNKLYLAQLFLPYSIKKQVFEQFKTANRDVFERSYAMLKERYPEIKEEKKYLEKIFKHSINSFIQRNNRFARLNKQKKVATTK